MKLQATIDATTHETEDTIRSLLAALLESKAVSAVLVPMPTPGGNGYVQTLISDRDLVEQSAPLAPTLQVHASTILKELTSELSEPIAAVLRPCELRAAIELEKFRQIDMENLITISADCAGTYPVSEFAALPENDRTAKAQGYLTLYQEGTPSQFADEPVRGACARCVTPSPVQADIHVSSPAVRGDTRIGFSVSDRFGEKISKWVAWDWIADDSADESASGEAPGKFTSELLALRQSARSAQFADLKSRFSVDGSLTDAFSTCIRCHNCMNVCPICYCKECVFKSSVFERSAGALLGIARGKGAARMPADTLVFHMTRMSHMGTSCVACGMCESACPSDIPVSGLFAMVGSDLQEMFEYTPGISRDHEPPVKVFKEDELHVESGSAASSP